LVPSRKHFQFLADNGVGGLQRVPHTDARDFYQFIVAPHDVLPTCELCFEQIDIAFSQNEKTLRPHVMVCCSTGERRSGNLNQVECEISPYVLESRAHLAQPVQLHLRSLPLPPRTERHAHLLLPAVFS
jgi:hypothetical protein